MYELLLSWMCTQANLIDEAETIVRKEMAVRTFASCAHQCSGYIYIYIYVSLS